MKAFLQILNYLILQSPLVALLTASYDQDFIIDDSSNQNGVSRDGNFGSNRWRKVGEEFFTRRPGTIFSSPSKDTKAPLECKTQPKQITLFNCGRE